LTLVQRGRVHKSFRGRRIALTKVRAARLTALSVLKAVFNAYAQ
jgi:hypothetical protein